MVVREYLRNNGIAMNGLADKEESFFIEIAEKIAPARDINFALGVYKDSAIEADVLAKLFDKTVAANECRTEKRQFLTLVEQYCLMGMLKGRQGESERVKNVFFYTAPIIADALHEKNDEKFMLYMRIILECAKVLL